MSGPAIIMSTSGMCTAGRIKHHLRMRIIDRRNIILFVGYQAHGTLGRQILDGADEVRIHGRMWPVRAQVRQIYGFSGHADRGGLLKWVEHFQPKPRKIFLTHGEEEAALALATTIKERRGGPVRAPKYLEKAELD